MQIDSHRWAIYRGGPLKKPTYAKKIPRSEGHHGANHNRPHPILTLTPQRLLPHFPTAIASHSSPSLDTLGHNSTQPHCLPSPCLFNQACLAQMRRLGPSRIIHWEQLTWTRRWGHHLQWVRPIFSAQHSLSSLMALARMDVVAGPVSRPLCLSIGGDSRGYSSRPCHGSLCPPSFPI